MTEITPARALGAPDRFRRLRERDSPRPEDGGMPPNSETGAETRRRDISFRFQTAQTQTASP